MQLGMLWVSGGKPAATPPPASATCNVIVQGDTWVPLMLHGHACVCMYVGGGPAGHPVLLQPSFWRVYSEFSRSAHCESHEVPKEDASSGNVFATKDFLSRLLQDPI